MIGIISDTHDNVINIKKAVEIFKRNNVDFVIHAGDVISPASVKYFEGLKTKFIFGNCDGERAGLEKKVKLIGGEHFGSVMELNVNGKTIGVIHGDNEMILAKMLSKGFDFLVHGHTHIPEDKVIGHTRVLCPGGHYLGDSAESSKVIILDAENGNVFFIDVK